MARKKREFRKGELVTLRAYAFGDPSSFRVRLVQAAGHGYLWVVDRVYGDQVVWLKSIATGELRSFKIRNVVKVGETEEVQDEQDAEDT